MSTAGLSEDMDSSIASRSASVTATIGYTARSLGKEARSWSTTSPEIHDFDTLHDQTHILSGRSLYVAVGVLGFAQFVCGLDQNGITTLIPTIAVNFNARSTIGWVGTSAFIGATVFTTLTGRLSDLFGRKTIFLAALVLLCFADLCAGFSNGPGMLFAFRTMAGVANGTLSNLTNIILSDFTTPAMRGAVQGQLGGMSSLGNGLGPIIGALLAQAHSWRVLFYGIVAPLAALAFLLCLSQKTLPSNMPRLSKQSVRNTLRKIDYAGVFLVTAAIVLSLVGLSMGGQALPWKSPTIIGLLTGGVVAFVAFCVRSKYSRFPILPFRLFKHRTTAILLLVQLLVGAVWSIELFYVPLYLQNVHGYTPLKSAIFMLPMVGLHALLSNLAGRYQKCYQRYQEIFILGFTSWTLASGLCLLCGRTTNPWYICAFLALVGVGTGCTLAITTPALHANTDKPDRAVVVSVRNFLRSLGGAVGLAAASAINGNELEKAFPPHLDHLSDDAFARPDLSGYSEEDHELILNAYSYAMRKVFLFCVPLMAVSLLSALFLKDRGLQRKNEMESGEEKDVGGSERVAAEV